MSEIDYKTWAAEIRAKVAAAFATCGKHLDEVVMSDGGIEIVMCCTLPRGHLGGCGCLASSGPLGSDFIG